MTVTLKEISAAFDALIAGTQSREEIARWAEERRKADDRRELIYDPPKEEARIWAGILYLIGVVSEVEPGEYLFSVDAFRAFRAEHGL